MDDKQLNGTFFFNSYFEPNNYCSKRPTRNDIDNIIKKFGNYEYVIPTRNMEGNDNGFLWIVKLTAQNGKERDALKKIKKIAHFVVYKIEGLIVEGPYCNIGWN